METLFYVKLVLIGCPISYIDSEMCNMFILAVEASINEMKINTNSILINDQKIQSIRFDNDIALIVKEELNHPLNRSELTLTKSDRKINTRKTKALVVSKTGQRITAKVGIQDETINRVKEFRYA